MRAGFQPSRARQASGTRAETSTSSSRRAVWCARAARARSRSNADGDLEPVAQAGRAAEVDFGPGHDEYDPVRALEFRQRHAHGGQPLGARAFHELEVVGVVDDAGSVGVLVVNADREHKGSLPKRTALASPEGAPAQASLDPLAPCRITCRPPSTLADTLFEPGLPPRSRGRPWGGPAGASVAPPEASCARLPQSGRPCGRLTAPRRHSDGNRSADGPGGARPKCRYDNAVATRPRDVRCRKPCWIRYGSSTSSMVSRSSPIAAARLSTPTGPPSNFDSTVCKQLAVHHVEADGVDVEHRPAPRRRPRA